MAEGSLKKKPWNTRPPRGRGPTAVNAEMPPLDLKSVKSPPNPRFEHGIVNDAHVDVSAPKPLPSPSPPPSTKTPAENQRKSPKPANNRKPRPNHSESSQGLSRPYTTSPGPRSRSRSRSPQRSPLISAEFTNVNLVRNSVSDIRPRQALMSVC